MKNKIILYITCLFVVVQTVLSILIFLNEKTIPLHWNLTGAVDSYGNSYNVFVLTVINITSYILLYWLSLHPEICNFPRPFKDRDVAFKNMSSMLRWIELFLSAIFLYITIGIFFHYMSVYIIYLLVVSLISATVVGIKKLSKS